MKYQKLLYKITGEAVPDIYSANHKIVSNFFNFFITQENQYLLGNGATMEEKNKKKLGADFDIRLQEAGENALIHGVTFCFWDLNRLRVFEVLEFVPIYDEETGALRAGIRFWKIDENKPLRATL
ncbi:MAG: phage portal protein [Firmicutes bacterium]|nr:phage portal protein [Bacillota bacterium]MBQ6686269.1 phage portal protein [Bacillota bacterium]